MLEPSVGLTPFQTTFFLIPDDDETNFVSRLTQRQKKYTRTLRPEMDTSSVTGKSPKQTKVVFLHTVTNKNAARPPSTAAVSQR
jgi:hypothetical protein